VDVTSRCHYISERVNLHPHEVFYTKQSLLIPIEIIDGEYQSIYFNIYILVHIIKFSL
jgi:hypothetical protein